MLLLIQGVMDDGWSSGESPFHLQVMALSDSMYLFRYLLLLHVISPRAAELFLD